MPFAHRLSSIFLVPERTAELEIKIESLETNLRESEVEANEVIGQWQSSCAEAESKYAIMEEELNNLKAADQTQDESSDKKNIDEANSMQALETLAQKEEELRQCKAEIESSNQSLQNLKGMVFTISLSLFCIIRLFVQHQISLLSSQLLLFMHRRSTGAKSRN